MNQKTTQAHLVCFLAASGLRVLISPAIIHLMLVHQLCAPTAAQLTEESKVVGSQEPVRAEVGHDVVLPCKVEPPLNVTTLTVEWKCNKTVVHMYKNRADNSDSQNDIFRTRTSLFHEEMTWGNISLKLVNVTEADAGNYTCYVRKEGKVKNNSVTLIVAPVGIDGKMKETFNPTTKPNSNWCYLLIPIGIILIVVVAFYIRKKKKGYKNPNDQGNDGANMENTNSTGKNRRGHKSPKRKRKEKH